MKRLTAALLLITLILCLCACGESKEPEEIADVPNIDHNILDADRHLGNSYENYSSEDTLLVEYGNRIYHAYNSQHEIMEYCTANDKERSLGIYGTNLSVYKNVLYYISEDSLSIHAFDLATNTDSMWITGENVESRLSEKTNQNLLIKDLFVGNFGICFILGAPNNYLIHLDYDKNVLNSFFASPSDHAQCVIASNSKLYITRILPSALVVYNLNDKSSTVIQTEDSLRYPFFHCGNNTIYLWNSFTLELLEYIIDNQSLSPGVHSVSLPFSHFGYYVYDDYIYYGFFTSDTSVCMWKSSISENKTQVLNESLVFYDLSFTANKIVYGIMYNPNAPSERSYFKSDLDFKNITYLD